EMLAQTIEQMIAPDPKQRPPKAAHVAKALRVFLATEEETRGARVEENIAAPVSPSAPASARDDEGPEDTEETPRAARRSRVETENEGDETPGKLDEVWQEIRPRERDLVFLSAGAVGL